MPNNRISPDLLAAATDARRRSGAQRPSLRARLTARLNAYQLDRHLAVGVPAQPGSALAVHEARLTSVAEVGRAPVVTRVPGLPTWLAGVANWRARSLGE